MRAPGGCPWDREQTPLTLRSTLLEETYEALEAINEAYENAPVSSEPTFPSPATAIPAAPDSVTPGIAAGIPTTEACIHAKEELGDVLLNVSMIAYMFEQEGAFTVSDVLDSVCEKLIRRHPHVFPESSGKSAVLGETKTAEQVLTQWEAIKQKVEGRAGKSILDEVSKGLEPLSRAYKMQKKRQKKVSIGAMFPPSVPRYSKKSASLKKRLPVTNPIPLGMETPLLPAAVSKLSRYGTAKKNSAIFYSLW